MSKKSQRILAFYRTSWNQALPNRTLESCIKNACNTLRSVKDRSISREDAVMSLAHLLPRQKSGGLFLHIVSETPGEAASVVPADKAAATEIAVGTSLPPDDFEFMDGDAFLFVHRDDICICATQMHIAAVQFFLRSLFTKAGLKNNPEQLLFMRAADIKKVTKIRKEGVKSVEISASLYEASASYMKRKLEVQGILGTVARHVRALTGNEKDVTDDALKAKLTLTVDKRRRKGVALGTKRIEDLALDLVNSEQADDDFVIETNTGGRITASEIYVRARVPLEKTGKSLHRSDAWSKLEAFYNQLRETGQLDE